jgi:prepilin-type processing-associated H-X9-DG protein
LFYNSFSIATIGPLAGDYNRDGKFDMNDHVEWRKAFGESQPQFLYADGNNDGIVDMADYLVWRKAMTTPAAGTTFGPIPEPAGLLLAGLGSIAFLAIRRRPKDGMRVSDIAETESPSPVRRASTLVEVMVAMAILGTMASLLLPAVQGARESSRAMTCRNNLKQIGLALLNYESNHKRFPKGAEGRFDIKLSPVPMVGLSWWADTLPHLEGGKVADRLDRTGANTGWAKLNAHNGELANGYSPSFWFCPSSAINRFVLSGDFQIALPSYTGISGATNEDGFRETRVNRCCRSEGQISAGGVLIPNAVVRSKQITDGLAKTLIVGEQSDFAYTQAGQPMNIGPAHALGWLAGTYALDVPPNYLTWLAPSYNLATVRYPLNERRYDLPGIWLDHGANNPLLSPHPGIVNLLYADGSVHDVNETLDVAILKSLATRDDGGSIVP